MLIGFETMAEEMSAMVFTVRSDGELDYVNRRCVEYLGRAATGVVTQRWTEWIHPDDVDAVLADRDEAVLSGAECERLQRICGHDGVYRWHSVSLRPVHDDHGGIAVWVGVAVDVHDREVANRAVARSEERFRLLAEVTADVVFDWDVVANQVWGSNDLSGLVGVAVVTLDHGVGIESVLRFVHPDDIDRVRADIRALDDGSVLVAPWFTTFRFVRAGGATIEVLARSAVVRDDTGRVIRVIGCLVDWSAQKRLEQQFARDQHLDTFAHLAGGLAHELNNILAVVIGSTDELLDGLEDRPPMRELASLSHDAAQRGANLVADLQAFARQQRLSTGNIDVPALLDTVARSSRHALGQTISIDVSCDDAVGPLVADGGRLESALFHLCLNAADAMPDGGQITLRAANATVPADAGDAGPLHGGGPVSPGGYVLIEVVDTGVGMSAEVLEQAVEPLFTTKGRAQHTGLGLSAVQGFATQSGGHLSISSDERQGTTVRLYLPRNGDPDATDDPPPVHVTAASNTVSAHVLVVDDDTAVRTMVTRQLTRLGYAVSEAATGTEALVRLESDPSVDLLFTDAVMPGDIDGPELVRRARHRRPDLPVLLTSGNAESVTRGAAPGGGVQAMMSRPDPNASKCWPSRTGSPSSPTGSRHCSHQRSAARRPTPLHDGLFDRRRV